MGIEEIRDQASSTIIAIHKRLTELQSLVNELTSEGESTSPSRHGREDFAIKITDLEMTIRMVHSMTMDFDCDFGRVCEIPLLFRVKRELKNVDRSELVQRESDSWPFGLSSFLR